MGVFAIIGIILLIIGPMFLFSTTFSFFGSTNPVSRVELQLQFGIKDSDNNALIQNQDFFKSAVAYNTTGVS